jgi:hypothetical protein
VSFYRCVNYVTLPDRAMNYFTARGRMAVSPESVDNQKKPT